MNPQTLTQTINIIVGSDGLGLASTGSSLLPLIAIGITLIIASALVWHFGFRRSHKTHNLSFRSLGILLLLAVFGASLALSSHGASAAPTLSLAANQNELTVTVPEGGSTTTTTTTLTSGTTNADGYTLTAALTEPESGIAIKLKGGNITTPTALTAGAPALTLKTTNSANPTNTTDTTDITLDFTIDATVTPGKKDLKLAYVATDNGSNEDDDDEGVVTPTTMQSMTQSYCQNNMEVYTAQGDEDKILTLTDSRGGTTRSYQVAKLADGKCWMLDNLKLGSTESSITLTPEDTDVASNFTLPQLYGGDSEDHSSNDIPYAYGPVPGDTGAGATNYGYLYNWSAATAGETGESRPGGSGNAPYSICPANWRLPVVVVDYESEVFTYDFLDLDRSFGGTDTSSSQGEPNIAKWQNDGPFKGVFAGHREEGFSGQGDVGVLWSGLPHPYYGPSGAMVTYFKADSIYITEGSYRAYGLSVRCVLR